MKDGWSLQGQMGRLKPKKKMKRVKYTEGKRFSEKRRAEEKIDKEKE